MNDVSLESIFFAALDRSPSERTAYLDVACGGDAELRANLEKMLAAQTDLGEFLDRPHPVPAEALRGGALQPPDHAGAVIADKYKLLQRIGEGGMGSVWMADQLQPVKRRVAVKLVRAEYGGSRDILARFGAERQAIALMDHPFVAKLLDAGTTGKSEEDSLGAGRPYFVMELVKGVPLNEFCDRHQLTVHDRLRLFTQICAAVQHAHQKGVIHRDLKPSNILVESHDGKPVPRVIDFGLAKAVGGLQLTENTLFTRLGTVAGTPQYMAPEQATFNALDVDTRADVYALGVVLYELLTGTTPIEREQLQRSSLDEIFRVIRESEPPIPSKRLRSTDSKPTVAANRQMEPLKLGRFLRGELDWIVMKALAKERDRRYQSANGFAEDIERFLNHEPVLAGPPSAAYQLRKFVRRHRPQVIAGCLLLAALLAGIGGTTFGMIRAVQAGADEAEQRGIAEANEAKAVAAAKAERLAKLGEAGQRKKAEKARDRTRQALDAMTTAVTGDSLATQMAISAEQRTFLAEMLTYYQEFAGEQAEDESSRVQTAEAALRVGIIEYRLGRNTAAEVAFRLAQSGYAKLAADFPAVPPHREGLATSHNNLGVALKALGKREQALDEHLQAMVLREKLVAALPDEPSYRQDLAESRNNLGALLNDLGKREEAEEQLRKALPFLEKLVADFPAVAAYRGQLASSHNNLGFVLEDLRQWNAAEEQHRKALALRQKLADDFPSEREFRQGLASSHNNLGLLLNDLGNRQEAEEQHRKALAIRLKLIEGYPAVPEYRQELAASHNNLGMVLKAQRKSEEAMEHYRKGLVMLEKLAADLPAIPLYQIELGAVYCNVAGLLSDGGQPGASLEWFEKAIRTLTPAHEHDRRLEVAKRFLRNSHQGRAITHIRLGSFAEAVKDCDKAVELSPEAEQGWLRSLRAYSQAKAGRVAEAVADAAELTKTSTWDGNQWYVFACIYTIASGKSAEKKSEYADRAMELLRLAVNAGYNNASRMANDMDLEPLRGRDDFKKLLEELAKKQP